MKQFEYWFDEEREMIYFSIGYQSLVANGGYFFWPIEGTRVFFHEDSRGRASRGKPALQEAAGQFHNLPQGQCRASLPPVSSCNAISIMAINRSARFAIESASKSACFSATSNGQIIDNVANS